jgi:hypothetical protein
MSHPLSERFQMFAESECRGSSPLYYALSHALASDDSLLEIAEQSRSGQPVPNLFFASVHYLLSFGISDPLCALYATCTETPTNPSQAYPVFRDFVLRHREEVISLLQSRLVQTNEVRRCAYLFPALLFAASLYDSKPLALIEIGTSAGLNLLWDRYRYSYGGSAIYGDSPSPVLVTSSFRGTTPSILTEPLPAISHRIGLDLNIVDTTISDQTKWLRALIWPEHHERRKLLDAALKLRAEIKLDLRVGDGFSLYSEVAEEIPGESLLCVYHTHVANQIAKVAKGAFLRSVEELGKRRDVIHVFNNIHPDLHLTVYKNGESYDVPLANTDGHARWIEWLQKS